MLPRASKSSKLVGLLDALDALDGMDVATDVATAKSDRGLGFGGLEGARRRRRSPTWMGRLVAVLEERGLAVYRDVQFGVHELVPWRSVARCSNL